MADRASAEPLGEFERVRRFFAPLAGPGGLGLLDDAAIVDCRAGQRLVVTADAIVAGVHYLPDDPADLVARKLLRVNLSDLAAMGARPLHYLLTTALPSALGADWVVEFARGLAEDQRGYGIDLLGGDSVATSGPAVLSLTAIGEVAAGMEVRRSGARIGDLVWVSGTIGDAFLGLALLRGAYLQLSPEHRGQIRDRFCRTGRRGEQQLVIVAARREPCSHAGFRGDDDARPRRQRQRRQLDDAGDARSLADVSEIGDQAIGDVDHRMCYPS